MKRFTDIFLSLFLILIFSPLFFIIVFFLKFTGEKEIFFLQERIGKNGQKFKLIKFATMLKNSPIIGTKTLTIKNDPRILPLGYFLRKTKINEFPQLLNILFGDMSFIGPRPLTHDTFSMYDIKVQKKIKLVRPGLSGIGSIIFRNEENIISNNKRSIKSTYSMIARYKGQLESWYINNDNLYIYLKLFIITCIKVIFPSSRIVWKVFKDLPQPPKNLKYYLNLI
jgi:lipopolysaccharide/colanic/teichoic acid biosynthesis glycosyltransferase